MARWATAAEVRIADKKVNRSSHPASISHSHIWPVLTRRQHTQMIHKTYKSKNIKKPKNKTHLKIHPSWIQYLCVSSSENFYKN
ncbi:hypothetical protein M5D96_007311, partial [Drosophila gunungcola]